MNKKNVITGVISLIIALVFVFFQLKKLNIEEVKAILSEADYFYLIPSLVLGVLSLILRALRWKLLLNPIGYRVSTRNAFAATAITYLANTFIPRSGEIFRCSSLYKTDKVPINKSFGTVLVERGVDLIFIF